MNRIIKASVAIVAAFILIFGMSACGVSTTTSTTKVHVGGGMFEDAKFKECIPPSTNNNSPTNDDYFAYPVSERDLDATGQKNADTDPITVVSSDNAEMAIPITIRFNMVSDCDTLNKFHKAYGERYSAYLNDDGTSSDGWLLMLRKLMYDPLDTTLDEIAKKYKWRDLYNNAQAQNELKDTITQEISKIVDENARGKYFENYTVLMKKPFPTNTDLKNAVAEEQAAVASAASAEAKARAQKAQADAETALARANAAKQQAEIRGFGGFENYAKAKAVEEGMNPFQPTYKVSETR